MFWKKSRALVEEIHTLLDLCQNGISAFSTAMQSYYEEGLIGTFSESTQKVKEIENQADHQVYKIKTMLFSNFLLPESREEIALLLSSIDDIIDNAMHATKFISLRKLEPCRVLTELNQEIISATAACFTVTKEACTLLFQAHQETKVRDTLEEVGRLETICDDVQNRMIEILYASEIDPALRILYSQLNAQIGSVSDACEDAAAIMGIMNMKRII